MKPRFLTTWGPFLVALAGTFWFSSLPGVPGTRYVYAVLAVDSRLPVPNMSAESTRIEETAR